jgi:hypothetical protein
MGTTLCGAWERERVLAVLATRVAMAAMRGRVQPMAATVLARIEAAQ